MYGEMCGATFTNCAPCSVFSDSLHRGPRVGFHSAIALLKSHLAWIVTRRDTCFLYEGCGNSRLTHLWMPASVGSLNLVFFFSVHIIAQHCIANRTLSPDDDRTTFYYVFVSRVRSAARRMANGLQSSQCAPSSGDRARLLLISTLWSTAVTRAGTSVSVR